ncbi:MAG: LysR family transcriptional regulator [Coriobacteriia bacterium]|nr:LysR family transcriptional regulator [Coriobacteriia bacterium]
MNLKQLEYFIAIAEEHQITAAARRLHISQPPLSYELAKLEKELGVQLVVRGPRSVSLTEAGKVLYERATRLVALARATEREVANVGSGAGGTITLGVDPSCAGLMPADRLLDLRRRFPNVEFEVRESATPGVMDLLDGSIADIGVVRTPFKSDGLRCRFAAAEPLVAVMPPSMEVGTEAACTVDDLFGTPLIVNRRLLPEVEKAFEITGGELRVAITVDDPRTAALWAREGMGVALVPRSLIRVTDTGEQFIKTVESRELETRPAVIWKAQHAPSDLFRTVVALLGDLS